MMWTVRYPWPGLTVGAVVDATDLAGCNMTMLVARGVLVPATTNEAPAEPVETADEPEEQDL